MGTSDWHLQVREKRMVGTRRPEAVSKMGDKSLIQPLFALYRGFV